jgi:hypothetical protein
MALYSMAIRSHDDKRLTYPYLQASQVSISNCIRYPPPYAKTDDLRKKYCIIGMRAWMNEYILKYIN